MTGKTRGVVTMEITPEFMLSTLAGAMLGLAAIGKYLQAKNKPEVASPHLPAVLDRDHADRIARALEAIAVSAAGMAHSVEVIADKRQSDMQKTLQDIAEKMATRS